MKTKDFFAKIIDYRVARTLFALLWIPFIIIYIYYSVKLFCYPYEWEPGEGSKILYAQRILEGKPVYRSNQTFPMLGNCYPPVYPAVIAPFVKFGGAKLIWGRIVSFASIIAMMVLLLKIGAVTTGSRLYGMVCASCFVFPAILSSWYSLARMDSLCSFFLLCSAYVLFRYRDSLKSAFFAGVLSVFALYTKQTSVFVVAMIGLYTLLSGKPKRFFMYSGCVLFIGGCLFIACQWLTDGWFYRNLFSENTHRVFFAHRYRIFYGWLVWGYAPFICAFALFGIGCRLFFKNIDIWVFYFIGGIINSLLIGANGSGYNYFITLWSAISLLFVQGMAYFDKLMFPSWKEEKSLKRIIVFFITVLLSCVNFNDGKINSVYQNTLVGFVPDKPASKSMERLEYLIKTSKGSIFVDRFPSIAMKYNKNQYYMEPAFIQELYHSGNWNPTAMVRRVESKSFTAMFILSDSLLPYPVKEAIRKNYFVGESIKIRTFEVWLDQNLLVLYPKQVK